MDWEIVAPMMVALVGILTTGGVLVLRPISKKLGTLIEAMAREKTAGNQEELRFLRDVVETTNQRMALMEERLEFNERLLGRNEAIEAGAARRDPTPPQPT